MVCKRVRGLTLGRSLPVLNFVKKPPGEVATENLRKHELKHKETPAERMGTYGNRGKLHYSHNESAACRTRKVMAEPTVSARECKNLCTGISNTWCNQRRETHGGNHSECTGNIAETPKGIETQGGRRKGLAKSTGN